MSTGENTLPNMNKFAQDAKNRFNSLMSSKKYGCYLFMDCYIFINIFIGLLLQR